MEAGGPARRGTRRAEDAGRVTAAIQRLVLAVAAAAIAPGVARAQAAPAPQEATSPAPRRAASVAKFLAGGALGLAAHEGGHLAFDFAFDAEPEVRRVNFHGIPFFAIRHRDDLPPAREFIISSAGFWVQHAGNEWLLTRRPNLRAAEAPIAKGLLAFNVLASAAYAAAAFARTGPQERDTRGIAASARIEEPWVGALVLAPAVLDTWRFVRPDSAWARWASRAVKAGGVLMVIRAARGQGRPAPAIGGQPSRQP